MKKCALIFILVACALLAAQALAHSGGTDYSGGHYDSSSGTYHYHHGYPAHTHTDLDGDGLLDCPYDFDESTGVGGQSPVIDSPSIQTSNGVTPPAGNTATYNLGWVDGYDASLAACEFSNLQGRHDYEAAVIKLHKTEAELNQIAPRRQRIFAVIGAASATIVTSFVAILLARQRKENFEELLTSKLEEKDVQILSLEQQLLTKNRGMDNLRKALVEYAEIPVKKLFLLVNDPADEYHIQFPDEVEITLEGIPYQGYPTKDRPFGNLTVFVTYKGSSYHKSPNCAGSSYERCICDPQIPAHGCCVCRPRLDRPGFDTNWYANLQKLLKDRPECKDRCRNLLSTKSTALEPSSPAVISKAAMLKGEDPTQHGQLLRSPSHISDLDKQQLEIESRRKKLDAREKELNLLSTKLTIREAAMQTTEARNKTALATLKAELDARAKELEESPCKGYDISDLRTIPFSLPRPLTKTQEFFLRYDPTNDFGIRLPPHVEIDEYGIPYLGLQTQYRPFGELTVYTTKSGDKYHSKRGCSKAYTEKCIYADLACGPCSRCSPPPLPKENDWYKRLNHLRYKRKIPLSPSSKLWWQPRK